MIGLIACGGTASRIFNLPKFILPLKDKNISLLTYWCKLMIEKGCNKIIIGSSKTNKPFIEHIINTQLNNYNFLIFIKLIDNSLTMNETILKMVKDEDYNIAIMGNLLLYKKLIILYNYYFYFFYNQFYKKITINIYKVYLYIFYYEKKEKI